MYIGQMVTRIASRRGGNSVWNALRGLVMLSAVLFAVAYWLASRPKESVLLDTGVTQTDSTGAVTKGSSSDGSIDGKTTAADAKDFTAPALSGRSFHLSALRGRYILLNFWATWCPPCLEELPSLVEFARTAARKMGIEVVAVSVDESWAPVRALFSERLKMNADDGSVRLLLDSRLEGAKLYGSVKFPETFLIDREFKVIRKFAGAQNWMSEEWLKWIRRSVR